ncbi:STAS-like domain-containing protein [Pseudomonas viridiflava]|uniref:STAS-like domain-containing protein n=1 Tax=Pseudomonas viridiflava TaxID=33069 RepID=UPI001981BD6B|nr:STAS-like domain-containing protein [Pseudomonas viridiflava]
MNIKDTPTQYTLVVVKEFATHPYGRYPTEGEPEDEDFSGATFRKKYLAKYLREYDTVHVILDGYNRYGRSFLDEAFGGLIREENFTAMQLDEKLTYSHSLIKSIEQVIADRIAAAEKSRIEGRI